MKWVKPREYAKRTQKPTFHLLLHGSGSSAIIGLDGDLRAVLQAYYECNVPYAVPTTFVVELVTKGKRSARIILMYILTIFKEEVTQRDYPYTVDWTAIQPGNHRGKRVTFLTFAVRPCDFRELG
jgi:hypothetical protein